MSFDTLRRDRVVQVIHVSADATDEYGNPIESKQAGQTTRARRSQLSATEDVAGRDEQARLFTYFLKPNIVIGGRDQLLDDGKTYDVLGEPDVLGGPLGPSHIEARVRLVEG